ncbi:MAG: T9SS type A sorting domain-containing protein [Bacteroidetes bacterium]|nr:T9SS type A sorting domain-containing protein [Bacteroidota bacterium]
MPFAIRSSTPPPWEYKFGKHPTFIEHKGQAIDIEKQFNTRVWYMARLEHAAVYFTSSGLIYQVTEITPSEKRLDDEEEREQYEKSGKSEKEYENEARKNKITQSYLQVLWEGSNPSSSVIAENQATEYHNFYNQANKTNTTAHAFKKITYKNIYPLIDIEYTFHEEAGIKYDIILHPGADPSLLKMKYPDAGSLCLDKKGNVQAAIPHLTLLDKAPKTYYALSKQEVSSSFKVTKNSVTFNLKSYDTSKELIIDPWTTTTTNLVSNKNAYDIGTDGAGNVYIAGGNGNSGSNGYLIAKYSIAGVLQWTTNTGLQYNYYGDMVTDINGNCYFAEGAPLGNICKMSSAGAVVWSTTAPSSGAYEGWALAVNPSAPSQVITSWVDGGDHVMIANLNTATGATSGALNMGLTNEVRSMCIDPGGNVHALTCTVVGWGSGPCSIVGGSSTFSPVYNTGSGYTWNEGSPLYSTANAYKGSGMNGIVADNNFVYTTNGAVLQKRSPTTGAILLSVAVPNGVVEKNGGVTVDACGNIYVGSKTGVYQFNTLLAQTGFVATTGAVYDVRVNGKSTNVVACGVNFVAALSYTACSSIVLPVVLLDLNATCTGNNVNIQWTTSSETNNAYFTLEKSDDGINFTPFKKVPGAGNSAGNTTYTVTDSLPFSGINYYLLKQTDFEGNTQSYPVAYSFCEPTSQNSLFIYPNPATTEADVVFNSREESNTTILITDAIGRVIYTNGVPLLIGTNRFKIDMSSYDAGIYFITLNSRGKTFVERLVKK